MSRRQAYRRPNRTLRHPRRASGAPVRGLQASYDAAQYNSDNRRHWAAADSLSADAANSPEIRAVLRRRSRYEAYNNCYSQGILLTYANDVIGTGPRLQLKTPDSKVNRFVEKEFAKWAKAVKLAAKLRMMRKSKLADGEVLCILSTNPKLKSKVKLDLRVIEADQCATPDLSFLQKNRVDGIVFDEYDNPETYHILKQHPGDATQWLLGDYDEVPADRVIHWFRQDRPGQHRGIPEILAALPLFAQLRRYTLAVIATAETAADVSGILKTETPPDPENDITPGVMDELPFEKRLFTVLPYGTTMEQFKAEQPTTTYGEFKREILNEIARCINMPYNIAAGDSSDYNYASGRLDHQTYFRAVRIDRKDCEEVVVEQIFEAWLQEATLIELEQPSQAGPAKPYLPQPLRMADAEIEHEWFWDGFEHVDPQKEANADDTRLANGTLTLADYYGGKGEDWEPKLEQRAREIEMMRSRGIPVPGESPVRTQTDAEDEDEPAPAGRRQTR